MGRFGARQLDTKCLVAGIVSLGLVPLAMPLTEPGLAMGRDTQVHIGNVVESAYLLKHGLPPWDWLPDVAGGYGGPNYHYYGELAFVLPGALVNAGFEVEIAMKALVALSLVAGFLCAFLYCAHLGGGIAGLAGAFLYVYAPYYVSLAYVRGAYPELLACSVYPLLFFFSQLWIERGRYAALGCAAMVFALVIGVHTLSFIIVGPFVVLSSLAVNVRFRRGAARTAVFLVVSVLVASPFLMGPLLDRDLVSLADHFGSSGLFERTGIPWYSLLNRDPVEDIVSHARAGRLHAIAWVACAIVAFGAAERQRSRRLLAFLALALIALLICERTGARLAVAAIPWLVYLQFPWRLLSIFSLLVAAATAVALRREDGSYASSRFGLVLILIACCALIHVRWIPEQRVPSSRTSTREGIRASLTTLDHENKYMPRGTCAPTTVAPDVLLALKEPKDGEVLLLSAGLNDYAFAVAMTDGGAAEFHQFWWPGWRCTVDGSSWPLRRSEFGIVELDLPSGHRTVRLYFVRSARTMVAMYVSGGVLLLLFAAAVVDSRRRARRRP